MVFYTQKECEELAAGKRQRLRNEEKKQHDADVPGSNLKTKSGVVEPNRIVPELTNIYYLRGSCTLDACPSLTITCDAYPGRMDQCSNVVTRKEHCTDNICMDNI